MAGDQLTLNLGCSNPISGNKAARLRGRAASRRFYHKHRIKERARQKKWASQNKEQRNAYMRKWYRLQSPSEREKRLKQHRSRQLLKRRGVTQALGRLGDTEEAIIRVLAYMRAPGA